MNTEKLPVATAESVTPLHPDKICDRISDAILDACVVQDPDTRAAIETMGGHGIITVTGELSTKAYVDIHDVARTIVGKAKRYGVQVNVVRQSPEIASGVDAGGAGDQGIMIGYATNETEQMIPMEHFLARDLCQYLFSKTYEICDGKTQVTIDYQGKIQSIVASFQHESSKSLKILVQEWMHKKGCMDTDLYINPAGDWDIGGFEADTGLTGRKIAVDSYGPQVPIGGGAFSGKDLTKVDRSGAYAARALAIKTLKEYCLDKDSPFVCPAGEMPMECIVRLAYAIGVPHPVAATAVIRNKCTGDILEEMGFDLASLKMMTDYHVKNMAEKFRPDSFEETAKWGHFGHDHFPWEK